MSKQLRFIHFVQRFVSAVSMAPIHEIVRRRGKPEVALQGRGAG